jgi:hypothetical protein
MLAMLAVPSFAANVKTDSNLSNAYDYYHQCFDVSPVTSAHLSAMTAEQYRQATECIDFTAGLYDGIILANVLAEGHSEGFFTYHQEATVEQVMMITTRYMANHPDRSTWTTSEVMPFALQIAFPPSPSQKPALKG